MERELKLLLDPASRSIIEHHPVFAAAEAGGELRQETTTYFDTPDLELRRHGASLRVREAGSRFVQTLKLELASAAVYERGEWEWPLASAEPDPAKLASLPPEAALVREAIERVRPIFTTQVNRKIWHIELEHGTAVEAVLDQGMVQADTRNAAICEVELELKHGSMVPLFRLAIDLADRAALRYGPQSKAERGYALIRDELPPKQTPAGLGLDRKATIAEAFPSLVNAAVRQLAAEIPLAANRNVEGVHRMRAAIRKLRTLLVLFAPFLETTAADRFNADLRDLGRVLGQGRDWDVFLTETLPEAEGEIEPAGLSLIKANAEARSREAHTAVSDAMGGRILTGLILGLGAWTADSGWLRGAEPDALVRDVLPQLLTRLERKVRRRAKHLDGASVEKLHELRKAFKKLRYSVEDIEPLFPHKGLHRYLKAIKATLAVLGEINDAAVTGELVGDVVPADRPDLAAAAAGLLRWNKHRRGKSLGKLNGKLKRFFGEKPFWA